MNIKSVVKELRLEIRSNKKILRDYINSLLSFFKSGNNAHIIEYQDVIQNYAKDICSLDDIINLQEEKLKGLLSQNTYKKIILKELYQHRKKSVYNREIMKARHKNHLLFYDINKEQIMKKLHQKYDGLIVEEVPDKPITIECKGGYILEM